MYTDTHTHTQLSSVAAPSTKRRGGTPDYTHNAFVMDLDAKLGVSYEMLTS